MSYQLPSDAPATFPTRERLEQGVWLGTIFHAISTLPAERFYDEYEWRGHLLGLRDYNETYGYIWFDQERVVGAFMCAESEYNPFGEDLMPPYDAEDFFAAAPPDVLTIARERVLPELVQWLGDEAEAVAAIANGTTEQLDDAYFAPVISAAFWSDGEVLTSGKSWTDVYRNGAHLLHNEFLDVEEALAEWENGIRLLPEQVALVNYMSSAYTARRCRCA